ncbi:MAG: hypothetical protein HBSIN02_12730 [Bacteroidia bacterium]|nr:MAG: hypothetical protein HBSIN02_12730 [Bacteroidia bacterium]
MHEEEYQRCVGKSQEKIRYNWEKEYRAQKGSGFFPDPRSLTKTFLLATPSDRRYIFEHASFPTAINRYEDRP